jgi:predicted metal-dependent hydrolase
MESGGGPGAPLEHAVLQMIAQGVQCFDAGAFWHAHEAWEHAWKRERGHDRHFLKGLIQFAAALHHWHRGRTIAVERLLGQAAGHLSTHHSQRWPFVTEAVLQQIVAARAALHAGGDAPRPRLLPHYRGHG